jgi:alpha-N-arabinofuranosidase
VNVIGCIKTTKTAAFFDTTALPLMLYRREFGTLPLAVTGNDDQRGLDVAAAKTADGRAMTIGVVNPQAKPQTIGIQVRGAKLATSAKVWHIGGDGPEAINTAERQGVSITEEANAVFDDQITAPAHSVSVYRVGLE